MRYLICDNSHTTVVGPREISNGRVSVINQLDRPAALVTDPNEDYSRRVTRGQFLVRFIPAHQVYL